MIEVSKLCRCAEEKLMKLVAENASGGATLVNLPVMHDAGVGLCPLKKQKTVFGVLDEPPKTAKCCRLLSYLSLYDSNLATIVAASGAYSVVDVECTAVAALSKCRSYSSVVGATLESTSL